MLTQAQRAVSITFIKSCHFRNLSVSRARKEATDMMCGAVWDMITRFASAALDDANARG